MSLLETCLAEKVHEISFETWIDKQINKGWGESFVSWIGNDNDEKSKLKLGFP